MCHGHRSHGNALIEAQVTTERLLTQTSMATPRTPVHTSDARARANHLELAYRNLPVDVTCSGSPSRQVYNTPYILLCNGWDNLL